MWNKFPTIEQVISEIGSNHYRNFYFIFFNFKLPTLTILTNAFQTSQASSGTRLLYTPTNSTQPIGSACDVVSHIRNLAAHPKHDRQPQQALLLTNDQANKRIETAQQRNSSMDYLYHNIPATVTYSESEAATTAAPTPGTVSSVTSSTSNRARMVSDEFLQFFFQLN